MDRQPDGFGLVCQGAFDGLLDPPRTVGGQLGALAGSNRSTAFIKTHVALVDQNPAMACRNPRIRGQSSPRGQVGLDHLLAGLFVALLDPPGQLDLFLRGE